MSYMEVGSRAYRRTLFSMLLGSLLTFAILYNPQPLWGGVIAMICGLLALTALLSTRIKFYAKRTSSSLHLN